MGKLKNQKTKPVAFNRRFNETYSRGRVYKRPDKTFTKFSRQGFNNAYVHNQEYSRYSRKPYYNANHTQFTRKIHRKPPSRPSSPVLGSEEYMVRKIEQTSAIIMRQLLNPDEQVIGDAEIQNNGPESKEHYDQTIHKNLEGTLEQPTETTENRSRKKVTYDIEEIHKKIINHITNLNDGKRKNLVFANSSNYDIVIQQIQKQKRLEISRALRNMCSQSQTQESSDLINSIIPDIGIKIEDLPHDLIVQLSNNLNFNYEGGSSEYEFLNVLSQDTGYCSLGESQTEYEKGTLNQNSNFDQTSTKSDEPSSLCGTVDCNVNDKMIMPSENFRNMIIKEEIDLGTLNQNSNFDQTSIKSDEPSSLCGTVDCNVNDKMIMPSENFGNIIIKEEIDLGTLNKNSNFDQTSIKSDEPSSLCGTVDCNVNDKMIMPSENFGNLIIKEEIDLGTLNQNSNFDQTSIKSDEPSSLCGTVDCNVNEKMIMPRENFGNIIIKEEIDLGTLTQNSIFDQTSIKSDEPSSLCGNVDCNVNDEMIMPSENFGNIIIKEEIDLGTLNQNSNFDQISIKSDEPSALCGTVDCNVNDKITMTSENFGNIIINKELDHHAENSCINTDILNNVTKSLIPTHNKEINENTEISTYLIKQEIDQCLENSHNNSELLNGTNDILIPDINEIENNLPLSGKSSAERNYLVDNKEKREIQFTDDKVPDVDRQKCLGFLKNSIDVPTQTDEYFINTTNSFMSTFLIANNFTVFPKTISEAISRMLKIDEYISKLTEYRQTLFANFKESSESVSVKIHNKEKSGNHTDKTNKKRKTRKKLRAHIHEDIVHDTKKRKAESLNSSTYLDSISEVQMKSISVNDNENDTKKDCVKVKTAGQNLSTSHSVAEIKQQSLLTLPDIEEKILVIKAVENKLVAATESGKICMYKLENGQHIGTLQVSNVPITALWFEKTRQQNIETYIGSLENNLKVYDLHKHLLLRKICIDDSIQCLESKWGYIFIGCIRGTLMRYSIKKNRVEYEDKFSDNRILVIKATYEGARRILLVGSRNTPVCIRDAMTGLYMRTMGEIISPTVYSLIMEKSLIYCGTTNHDILVYSFYDGKLNNTYKITSSKGISCLKIIKNLLFASCHNGNIYVVNIKSNDFVDVIEGPGGVILSMEVLENQVIVGTMSFKFASVPIPQHILRYNCE